MPLGTEVGLGLGPGNIVLDGDSASPRKWVQRAPTFAVYGRRQACVRISRGPCLLWPDGWMAQDTNWYRGRPRPRRHRVKWGTRSLLFGEDPILWRQ